MLDDLNTRDRVGAIDDSRKSFAVIYADPPWRYASPGATTPARRIEAHYPTMSLDELKALRVPADPQSCVLFLWATAPLLLDAVDLMKAWGFEYKTNMVWDKELLGMGFWFRGQHELLLVGAMGAAQPPKPSQRVGSVLRVRRGGHSVKPQQVRELIEQWYPDARKLEIFARESHAGWYTFGNEVAGTLFDPEPRLVAVATAIVSTKSVDKVLCWDLGRIDEPFMQSPAEETIGKLFFGLSFPRLQNLRNFTREDMCALFDSFDTGCAA